MQSYQALHCNIKAVGTTLYAKVAEQALHGNAEIASATL
jgi:hypothetical protein